MRHSRYWREDAACRLESAELFDPPGVEPDARSRIDAAITICGTCPVTGRCLTQALRDHDSGVRAGQLLLHGKPTLLPGRPTTAPRGPLKPCGTIAAVARHRRRGEPLCDDCRAARRTAQRDRRRIFGRAA